MPTAARFWPAARPALLASRSGSGDDPICFCGQGLLCRAAAAPRRPPGRSSAAAGPLPGLRFWAVISCAMADASWASLEMLSPKKMTPAA